ncbi:MAG: helix-turn-helix domain-containing protein [Hoeflea sp.]|uniref:ArsR/SmtB family transcription factor n=1 Tax=Hoeflea sp. TaxID=1940281 RepID=UPI001D309257|nr:helix-turn-helix domain-containing protein [Hoeflea sp.]MBU4530415.1 helix-turn-helix domain-containing protein [Alphaproteobacteria bacterium]MBU4545202.1 helix-turn-helix domain-containing protein [Alphaproteobacteria bacterium]MBU4549598.1 helix-turn-helix domain-containing protein [Alphaproteobacteria bacterium]MBV1722005.1 helix-turn-helix domain-containing protein [Hoeflea sp.]MBV1761355.1 helix-turn-helix domain-containing protein [Hoeflea sp.]
MTQLVSGQSISAVAAMIGDVARANILFALMGGKALTATELSHHAGVSAPTTSGHLNKLLDGQLITVEKQGRHRYYRLASPAVAEALEGLSNLAASGPGRHRPTGPKDMAMRQARTCYDHMAGQLAVAMTDAFTSRGLIIVEDRSGLITEEGQRVFADFGIGLDPKPRSARPLCRTCLDWSERRMHLGGRLGAALLAQSLQRRWVRPVKESRALSITRDGERGFHDVFGIPRDRLTPAG